MSKRSYALMSCAVLCFWLVLTYLVGFDAHVKIAVGDGKFNQCFRVMFVIAVSALFLFSSVFHNSCLQTTRVQILARLGVLTLLGGFLGYAASLIAYAAVVVKFRDQLNIHWIFADPASLLGVAAALFVRPFWLIGSVVMFSQGLLSVGVHSMSRGGWFTQPKLKGDGFPFKL